MERETKKGSRRPKSDHAKEMDAVFKELKKASQEPEHLTYSEETDEYVEFVQALFYKVIERERDAKIWSWYCSSCFSFTFGSKEKHRDLGHPEEHTKSVSDIKKSMNSTKIADFVVFLQSEALNDEMDDRIQVKRFSLPKINKKHDPDERKCCQKSREQLQTLREENISLRKRVSFHESYAKMWRDKYFNLLEKDFMKD